MEHLLTVAQLCELSEAARERLTAERIAHRKALNDKRPALAAIIARNVSDLEASRDVLDLLLDGSGASAKISLVEPE